MSICSWGPPKCYIWQCHWAGHINSCTAKWKATGGSAISARINPVKHTAGSWLCFLWWRARLRQNWASFQKGARPYQFASLHGTDGALISSWQEDAVLNSGLLLMAVMGLVSPAMLYYTHTEVNLGKSALALSRFSSCIMLFAYAAFIYFELSNSRRRDESSEASIMSSFSSVHCSIPFASFWGNSSALVPGRRRGSRGWRLRLRFSWNF